MAACAALANVSFAEAKRIANGRGIHAADPALWSDTEYVQRLSSSFQIKTAPMEVPFTSWVALPGTALPAIKWRLERGKPIWDWGVFVRRGEDAFVLDSKKGLASTVRRDFGRMKPNGLSNSLSNQGLVRQ
ncbi:MAG: hypothetical protein P8166_13760 [Candidatus Thiodiazotropha sp.]